jgi:hypothetical protein
MMSSAGSRSSAATPWMATTGSFDDAGEEQVLTGVAKEEPPPGRAVRVELGREGWPVWVRAPSPHDPPSAARPPASTGEQGRSSCRRGAARRGEEEGSGDWRRSR